MSESQKNLDSHLRQIAEQLAMGAQVPENTDWGIVRYATNNGLRIGVGYLPLLKSDEADAILEDGFPSYQAAATRVYLYTRATQIPELTNADIVAGAHVRTDHLYFTLGHLIEGLTGWELVTFDQWHLTVRSANAEPERYTWIEFCTYVKELHPDPDPAPSLSAFDPELAWLTCDGDNGCGHTWLAQILYNPGAHTTITSTDPCEKCGNHHVGFSLVQTMDAKPYPGHPKDTAHG